MNCPKCGTEMNGYMAQVFKGTASPMTYRGVEYGLDCPKCGHEIVTQPARGTE